RARAPPPAPSPPARCRLSPAAPSPARAATPGRAARAAARACTAAPPRAPGRLSGRRAPGKGAPRARPTLYMHIACQALALSYVDAHETRQVYRQGAGGLAGVAGD